MWTKEDKEPILGRSSHVLVQSCSWRSGRRHINLGHCEMGTFNITMKTCLCLFAVVVVIVYVKGETCPSGHVTDCSLTACTGTDWVLGCVDNLCTCTHSGGGSHDCVYNGDCGNSHNCDRNQQWRCVQGRCRCIHNN
ncbi:hypothetical protein CHS0354_009325 [Potamilus streckersoni]|uniref:Uncharacterized protein n=1 Tax=Potamilus streckersoni TaxID=2493646 RepID=A0AAE0SN22_9BIVA|nr:hypothetical protein CHS0354_009325 [Potamilus streckersoni]